MNSTLAFSVVNSSLGFQSHISCGRGSFLKMEFDPSYHEIDRHERPTVKVTRKSCFLPVTPLSCLDSWQLSAADAKQWLFYLTAEESWQGKAFSGKSDLHSSDKVPWNVFWWFCNSVPAIYGGVTYWNLRICMKRGTLEFSRSLFSGKI